MWPTGRMLSPTALVITLGCKELNMHVNLQTNKGTLNEKTKIII